MEERLILKRGLADISNLFISTHEDADGPLPAVAHGPSACAVEPAPASAPPELIGLACDPALGAAPAWIGPLIRALLMSGSCGTLAMDPAAASCATCDAHPRLRILAAAPHDLARFAAPHAAAASPPHAAAASPHLFCHWIGSTWPHGVAGALQWCDRLVVALPPDAAAFLRYYRFLKRLGPLCRQRVFYYLLAPPRARLEPLRPVDDAWQAVTGRFLNVSVHCLGQFAPSPDSSTILYDPLWSGLRHLLCAADAPAARPPWREPFLAWAAEQHEFKLNR
jgi:hypothetical protein